MKKLLIIATVAMAALASNAATFDWSIMPNGWSATKPASGDTYYAVLSTAIESSTDLGKALASGNKDNILSELGKISEKSTGTFTTAFGNASGKITVDVPTATALSAVIIAMTDDQFLVSNAAAGQAYTPTATGDKVIATWSTQSGNPVAGTWTNFQAAPEPTSGLMLLLGVGLMALKRKRA